ncbi:4-hydroxyphenylacetate 3-hydroxylase C-terminal domain-containing protein [Lysinibacillus fusiformis]
MKEIASEIMAILEVMRSHLYKSEHNAKIDQYGNMTPDFEPLNETSTFIDIETGEEIECIEPLLKQKNQRLCPEN